MDEKQALRNKAIGFRESDLDILRGPYFISDQIIEFYFAHLASLYNNYNSDDVLLVPPMISFWIANSKEGKESIKEFVEHLKLPTRKMVLLPVNDNQDFDASDSGAHWSLLVFDRKKNSFFHLDSKHMLFSRKRKRGLNRSDAKVLYRAVKGLMNGNALVVDDKASNNPSSLSSSSSSSSYSSGHHGVAAADDTDDDDGPWFYEYSSSVTPQQENGYDCGLYVMAMAEEICRWYAFERADKCYSDWEDAIERVKGYVETRMRFQILELIQDLKNERQLIQDAISDSRVHQLVSIERSNGKTGTLEGNTH